MISIEMCKILGAIALLCGFLLGVLCGSSKSDTLEPAPQPKEVSIETTTTASTTQTTTPTTRPVPVFYYTLTDEERDLVERVVMAEAGAEAYVGQQAVAQCILNASELQGIRPGEVVEVLKYTKARPEPTAQVKDAVAAIFDDGATVFDRDVIYFYAPALVTSDWHESQVYVTTIGCHKFFKEARE